MMKLPRLKLIPDWRKSWRYLSVWALAFAALMLHLMEVWAMMPEEVKSFIPAAYVPIVAKWVVTLGFIGRYIQQNVEPPKPDEHAQNPGI